MKSSPDVPACSAAAKYGPKVVTPVAQSAGSQVAVHKIDMATMLVECLHLFRRDREYSQ
jgi:hypothetical protein